MTQPQLVPPSRPAPQAAQSRPPKPPTVIVMGPPGSGKTWSLTTLAAAGLDLFVLVTDPNGADSLLDSAKSRGVATRVHTRIVSPAAPGWDALIAQATTANAMGYEDIQKIKSGVAKEQTRQYVELLRSFQNFTDDTGRSWGDVTTWDATRALAIDSLSPLNSMIMEQTIGLKPSAHQGEWGVAMTIQLKLLAKLCSDLKCFFVVCAHTDRETDFITGASSVTISALGRKNASPIVGLFSEVVLAKRVGTTYLWSTSEPTAVDTKQRGLALSASLPPDFTPLVLLHKQRVADWKNAAALPAPASTPAAANGAS